MPPFGRLAPKQSTQLRRKESGSAIVEFGLVLLPLFAILFMTLDISWIVFAWACIQEGAREGCRYAVTGSGEAESTLDTATKAVVQQYSFGFAQSSNISVDYYPPTGYSSSGTPSTLDGESGATAVGNIVKITVSGVTMKSFGPILRTWNPISLSASATDVLQ